jgi:hypothetical protein
MCIEVNMHAKMKYIIGFGLSPSTRSVPSLLCPPQDPPPPPPIDLLFLPFPLWGTGSLGVPGSALKKEVHNSGSLENMQNTSANLQLTGDKALVQAPKKHHVITLCTGVID